MMNQWVINSKNLCSRYNLLLEWAKRRSKFVQLMSYLLFEKNVLILGSMTNCLSLTQDNAQCVSALNFFTKIKFTRFNELNSYVEFKDAKTYLHNFSIDSTLWFAASKRVVQTNNKLTNQVKHLLTFKF